MNTEGGCSSSVPSLRPFVFTHPELQAFACNTHNYTARCVNLFWLSTHTRREELCLLRRSEKNMMCGEWHAIRLCPRDATVEYAHAQMVLPTQVVKPTWTHLLDDLLG